MALEKTTLRLGYIPLTDCLPLVVAKEQGFFAAEGLTVELCCEASWANIRDKLIVGHLDGAQVLAPMLLAAGGIDPVRDIKLVALPPQQMVDSLRLEHIDAFCVGEPWNSCAAAMGLGRCLVAGYEIWQNGPEKVFGITEQWHEENPNTHAAVLRALDQAAQWIEGNLSAAVQLLDRGHYVEAPLEWLAQPLNGQLRVGLGQSRRGAEAFHVFHRYMANFPWRSQAQWFLQQMQRWGQIPATTDIAAVAARVYRADLYREVFGDSRSLPLADMKSEGEHGTVWSMPGTQGPIELGPDRFIDGAIFQPHY